MMLSEAVYDCHPAITPINYHSCLSGTKRLGYETTGYTKKLRLFPKYTDTQYISSSVILKQLDLLA